jgi:CRP/FNR family cyclic AMP-dependent transcriptional regulator
MGGAEQAGRFDRFAGERGQALALEALRDQRTLAGSREAAEALLAAGQIVAFEPDERLTSEGGWDNRIYFILAGSARISIRGFPIQIRRAGQHVGEMELVDPTQPQTATSTAIERTVALVVEEAAFAAVAARHPEIWRQIAKDLGDQIRNRNLFIRPSNPKPQLFIASASESLSVATAFGQRFEAEGLNVDLWKGGVFKPSEHTMESLAGRLVAADFAVAVFSADDKVESRGVENLAPRDNTVFELGLFAGAIGRERSFYAMPREDRIKIPSDLAGITSVRYSKGASAEAPHDVAEACAQILERIKALGPR